jgi:membrane-associated phospholipid phosphatase
VIRWLQGFRFPALDLAMRGFSFLGSESFLVLLFPFLYWCLDSRLGLRLAVVYFLSGFLNFALKQSLAQPRPADLAPGINLVEQPGYGLPSGHAQGAVVLWGLLALEAVHRGAQARCCGARRWVWALAVLLMLAIGLSRVYLGVHFPTDVLAGWAVGAVVLAAAAAALRRLPARAPAHAPPPGPARPPARAPVLARGLPWWISVLIASLLGAGALALRPESDSVAMVAGLWGFLTGHLLRRRYWGGGEQGSAAQRLLRLPVGLAVLLGLYLGLKRGFPVEGQALYLPLRFLRYSLVGAWVALGAPLLFRWLGLARPGGTASPRI